MRIIAGKLRGRKLAKVRGDIRPTPDRLRESLFNVIGESVAGSCWVDLFSGSGAVGIEALSRGARYTAFNDRDPIALRLIRENLRRCEIETDYDISSLDAFTFLRKPPRTFPDGVASFFFLDPPYLFKRYRKLLEKIESSPLFDPAVTKVVLEVYKKTEADFVPAAMCVERTINCGDSVLLLLGGRQEN